MTQPKLKGGDHVCWISQAGHVTGRIVSVHTQEYKGQKRRARAGEPQYEVQTDKTDHVAVHKGSALSRIK